MESSDQGYSSNGFSLSFNVLSDGSAADNSATSSATPPPENSTSPPPTQAISVPSPVKNRNSGRVAGVSNIEIRGLIASKDVGAIFGRGGANIKKLRSECKTIAQIPDCDSPERLLIVCGEPEGCYKTIGGIFPLIGDSASGPSEFRLLVHQSQAGAIIGRKGDRVKDLRTKHSLDIKIFSECCPSSTERIVRMKGQPASVIDCIREIHEILEAQQAVPRGPVIPYDPSNYNEYMCPEYGGFSMSGIPGENMPRNNVTSNTVYYNTPDAHQQELMMMDARRRAAAVAAAVNAAVANSGRSTGGGGCGGGGGGFMIDSRRNELADGSMRHEYAVDGTSASSSASSPSSTNSRLFALAGNGPHHSPKTGGGGHHASIYPPAQHLNPLLNTTPKSTQVTVPSYLVPAILGHNGSTLHEIKSKSGTEICIISAHDMNVRMAAGATFVAPTDSVINIIGSDPAIQKAQYLLQQTVKESGLWRAT